VGAGSGAGAPDDRPVRGQDPPERTPAARRPAEPGQPARSRPPQGRTVLEPARSRPARSQPARGWTARWPLVRSRPARGRKVRLPLAPAGKSLAGTIRRRRGRPTAAREVVRQTPAGRGPGSQLRAGWTRAGPVHRGLSPAERSRWGLVHEAREQAVPGRAGPGGAALGRTDPGKPRPQAARCRARSRPDQWAFRARGAFPGRGGRLVLRAACRAAYAAEVRPVPVRRRYLAPRQRRAGCLHPAPRQHLAWRRHRSPDARAVPRKTFPR
jgi:hypothetical protein